MTLKDLKHLIIFCVVVTLATVVMLAEDTIDERQDAIISQGAYFYGMSHLLKEEAPTTVNEKQALESKAFFWGVHF